MLKGLLMMSGYLILYIVYGKDGVRRKNFGVPVMLSLSVVFVFWLLSVVLLFAIQPIDVIALIFALIVPVGVAVWSVLVHKNLKDEADTAPDPLPWHTEQACKASPAVSSVTETIDPETAPHYWAESEDGKTQLSSSLQNPATATAVIEPTSSKQHGKLIIFMIVSFGILCITATALAVVGWSKAGAAEAEASYAAAQYEAAYQRVSELESELATANSRVAAYKNLQADLISGSNERIEQFHAASKNWIWLLYDCLDEQLFNSYYDQLCNAEQNYNYTFEEISKFLLYFR